MDNTARIMILAVIIGIMSSFVFAYSTNYTGDIKTMAPNNGQLMKNNGTLVNEADSIYVIQNTYSLTSAAINYTTAFTDSAKILEVEIHFDAPVTETVTITKVFSNTAYNTVRSTTSLTGSSNYVFNDAVFLASGQQLKIQCTNATALTDARVTITYTKLVR